MEVTEYRKELFKAISAAQGEFSTVDKGKDNPFFKSKYAPLDSIIEMIRPILPKHGLSVVQFTDIPESGNGIIIETVITHESGQYISGKLLMPLTKIDPQGAGSAITYGRRYALAAALGIVSDEDIDGNHNDKQKPKTVTRDQIKLLHTMLTTNKIDPDLFKDHFGITSSVELRAEQMADAVKWIENTTKENNENGN